ncbi:MAG: helix-turn-helix transcriptional regulator [Clostridia bacterium]|nr:helix-turn-helix transcriptional regulator [Clostridia bacterium]
MSEIEKAILLMRKHKITQREVAAETGYTEDWISMIFREKAKSDSAIEKILTAIDSIIANRTA